MDTVTETFAYDRLDRVTRHVNPLGSFDFSYLGQTRQLVSQQAGAVGTQWSYEDNSHDRRLKSIINSGQARGFQYATTPENQISTLTETAGGATQKSWHYAYDAADRLLSAQPSTGGSFSYGYDAADNLTSINGAMAHSNSVNQLTNFNNESFSHDGNGNLKDDGVRTYQWDAENRLISIGYKNDASKGTSFHHDGLGRRLAIIETNGGATTETRYLWCSATLCQARTAGDIVTRRYYPQGMAIPQGGTLLYYGIDHLGSVRDVLAAQNGAKVASYDYDPYGNQIATSGRISVDFRYAGMFYHPQSGLYLTNYRAYDPKTARWLSRDPIAEKGGLNLYGYVENSPLRRIDPRGLAGGSGPVLQGQSGVNQVMQELTGTTSAEINIGQEITIDTPSGSVRVDIGAYNPKTGNLNLTEVKNGPFARLATNQKACYPEILQGQFTPRGPNAQALGLSNTLGGGTNSTSLQIKNLNGANVQIPETTPIENLPVGFIEDVPIIIVE
ncbi:MAG: RHS repeat-associated core domain-containing protein [Nitrosospira sp.]